MGKIRIFIGDGWFKNGCELFHYIARAYENRAATGRKRYPGHRGSATYGIAPCRSRLGYTLCRIPG